MSKIPPTQRLSIEAFSKQAEWIGPLIEHINRFMEQTAQAMNKALTISDNFAGAVKTVELDGTFPVKIAWDQSARPVSVIVGNVYRSNGASFTLTDAVQVQWQFNQAGQLQIDAVTGITPAAGTKYKLVLECKAG